MSPQAGWLLQEEVLPRLKIRDSKSCSLCWFRRSSGANSGCNSYRGKDVAQRRNCRKESYFWEYRFSTAFITVRPFLQ